MDTKKASRDKLSRIQNLFFPIYRYELKKFLPLFFVFFCISFNYALIRVVKDSLVMGSGGAEAIYYLKAYGVTPIVVLFTVLYAVLCRHTQRDGRFNVVILYLVLFFLLFLLFVHPNIKYLRLDTFTNIFNYKYPKLKGLWSIIANWHISLFYIHSELWGSYALVVYWTFANEITNINQSARFYSFLAMAANFGSLIAGSTTAYVFKGDSLAMVKTFIFIGFISLIIYNIFSRIIKNNPQSFQINNNINVQTTAKVKLSLLQSFKFLLKSKYLLLLSILVLAYNMCISLIESIINAEWAKFANGNELILSRLGGIKIMSIGIVSTIFSFISTYLQRHSWKLSILFAPLMLLITFIFFYIFSYFKIVTNFFSQLYGIDALYLTIIIGTSNIILSKSVKYSFFEPAKERAYIPLDTESKIRGKAAVDGVGSRLGKGLGSLLLTLVYFPIGNGEINNCKNYIAITILIIIIIWILSSFLLSREYYILLNKRKIYNK